MHSVRFLTPAENRIHPSLVYFYTYPLARSARFMGF